MQTISTNPNQELVTELPKVEEPSKEWILQRIEVEYQRWGNLKGTYIGKISFQNKENESFSFNLRPDMTEDYLRLISEDIIRGATELGGNLLMKLPLKKQDENK
jgi:hypothetical protein